MASRHRFTAGESTIKASSRRGRRRRLWEERISAFARERRVAEAACVRLHQSFVEHLARKSVLGLEAKSVVIVFNRFIDPAHEVVGEPQSRKCRCLLRIVAQGALVVLDRVFVLAELAVCVAEVEHGRFPGVAQALGLMATELDAFLEAVNSGLVAVLAVVHDPKLVEHQRVRAAHGLSLPAELLGERHVVRAKVLDCRAEHREMRPDEEPRSRAVGSHCLVGLVLGSESMAKPEPGHCQGRVHGSGLVEEAARRVEFADAKVVAPHSKPGNRMRWVRVDQLMSGMK
mmetsp:Transcript_14807/g.41995  ORF Transcript_14807/g.41995 Transcript_14807/m.41995 type:complete len:287 (+) Transcript_14807:479-1339(+)